MENKTGVIYILTNPSFPDYVKIGYADDVDRRLKELNRSDCIQALCILWSFSKTFRSENTWDDR